MSLRTGGLHSPRDRRPGFHFPLMVCAILFGSAALAEDPVESTRPPAGEAGTEPRTLSELVRQLILHGVPEEYVDERHWGKTAERFDGLRFRGLRISRRKKEVPHGLWRRYRAALIRPEETLQVQIEQRESERKGTVPFVIVVALRARSEATFAYWSYGVKGLNGTTVADATLRMRIVLNVSPKVRMSLSDPLPKFDLRPEVAQVKLRLVDLDVRRIGVLGGEGAALLGDGSRLAVEELLKRQEGTFKKRLTDRLDRHFGDAQKPPEPGCE